jgi:hypothetical protein
VIEDGPQLARRLTCRTGSQASQRALNHVNCRNLPAETKEITMSRIPSICRRPGVPAGLANVLPPPAAAPAAPADPGGAASMSAGVCPALGWLSFRRIVDIPFEACVTALESWQCTGQDGDLEIGQSRLRGPIKHDRDSGTCRIQARLARGPLRSLLCMRLDIDRWSSSPSSTAFELIPCGRVRPTAAYFRAGHLLLDSLTYLLSQHVPTRHPGCATATQPLTHHGESVPSERVPAEQTTLRGRR